MSRQQLFGALQKRTLTLAPSLVVLSRVQMFIDLQKLLECKKKIAEQEKKERDNSIAIDKMVGGANVMTIE